MEHQQLVVSPQPARPGRDTPYSRNVSLSLRGRLLVLVDAGGAEHRYAVGVGDAGLATADALAWVSAPFNAITTPRLLVLDSAGTVLVELSGEGWDLDQLRDFGDTAGVPLVEEDYPDEAAARAAYPVPRGAVRVRSTTGRSVLVAFLPVLLPVLVLIVVALIASR